MISVVAFFLLLPISAPVYALLGPLSQIAFPWRMQIIFALCTSYLMAVWMEWVASPHQQNTLSVDMSICVGLLVLLSYFQVIAYDDEKIFKKAMDHTHSIFADQRTKWSDPDHFNFDYIAARAGKLDSIPKADVISGNGKVAVTRWAWDGIELQTTSPQAMIVRLDHLYFPVWYARSEQGQSIVLHPEEATGKMLLDVPPGEHHVALHYAVSYGAPWLVYFSRLASIVAVLLWLWQMHRTTF